MVQLAARARRRRGRAAGGRAHPPRQHGLLAEPRRRRPGRGDGGGRRLGPASRPAPGGAGARAPVCHEPLPAHVVPRPLLLPLPREPRRGARLRRLRQLPDGLREPHGVVPAPDDGARRHPDRRDPDDRRLSPGTAVRERVPGAARPPDVRADPHDAELRRDRRVLPLLLRADLRPPLASGESVHRPPVHPPRHARAGAGRHHHRRRLDVVALRDAPRPLRPGQRPGLPL